MMYVLILSGDEKNIKFALDLRTHLNPLHVARDLSEEMLTEILNQKSVDLKGLSIDAVGQPGRLSTFIGALKSYKKEKSIK